MRRTKIIRDKKNRKYEAVIHNFDDSHPYNFTIDLYHGSLRIGDSECRIDVNEKKMLLNFLTIYDGYQLNRNIFDEIGSFLFNSPKIYRRLGLGTELLKIVIDEAKESGVKFLHGRITQMGIEDNPNLLDWYKKHGFYVEPPLAEDKNSIARICLYLE